MHQHPFQINIEFLKTLENISTLQGLPIATLGSLELEKDLKRKVFDLPRKVCKHEQ